MGCVVTDPPPAGRREWNRKCTITFGKTERTLTGNKGDSLNYDNNLAIGHENQEILTMFQER